MRSGAGTGLIMTCMALAKAAVATAATPTAPPGDRSQDFVQTRAIEARCQKTLPGLKLQLQEGRQHSLSTLDTAQLQAAEAYANSKEGKALEKGVERDASRAFGRNTLSAAETWQYRACGRSESVRMAPPGQSWSMSDADRNRLFDALTR